MAFDTHTYVKKLQEAGFTAQQAEAQVELLLTVVEGNLATKHDIELVRHDIELVRDDVELVRRDTKEMEIRIDHKFDLVHQKIELARRDTIIWLGGILVAGFAVMAAMNGVVIALIAL